MISSHDLIQRIAFRAIRSFPLMQGYSETRENIKHPRLES